MLQAGRWRVRFQMGSLIFSIDILTSALNWHEYLASRTDCFNPKVKSVRYPLNMKQWRYSESKKLKIHILAGNWTLGVKP